MAPRNAYLEFDAQPARITPYTPTEVSASTYSRPALTSAITRFGSSGITAQMANAGISVIMGAMRNRTLLDFGRDHDFFDQQLDDVRERLKDARQETEDAADAVRTLAQLHPADDLALPQRGERHRKDQRDGDHEDPERGTHEVRPGSPRTSSVSLIKPLMRPGLRRTPRPRPCLRACAAATARGATPRRPRTWARR